MHAIFRALSYASSSYNASLMHMYIQQTAPIMPLPKEQEKR